MKSLHRTQPTGALQISTRPLSNEAKSKIVQRFSTEYLHNLLSVYNGNVTNAAAACGLERQGLQRIMRRYKIVSSDFKKNPSDQT